MSHYFKNDDSLKSEIRELKYTFNKQTIIYKTDAGIFSKDHIDFGSNVLLNSLSDLEKYSSVLDVGCGYGTIGLAIAKGYPDLKVDMVDVNERAVSLTKNNIVYNNLRNVNAFVSDLYSEVTSTYDCIISNPPIRAGKKVVFGVVEEGYRYLNENGVIYVVIQKKQGAPSLFNKMNEVYGNAEIINKEKGYYIIKSVK